MRSSGIRWALNLMTGILIWRDLKAEDKQGRRPNEDRGRYWSKAVTSRGIPRIVGTYQRPEQAKKYSSLEPRVCRDHGPTDTLI